MLHEGILLHLLVAVLGPDTYTATPDIERGRLVEVFPEYTVLAVDVSLVMPAAKERSVAARVLVDFIRQRAAGNPRWFDV